MNRLVLSGAALLTAVFATSCAATPPPPPTANTGERLDRSLIAPLRSLIDPDLDVETKQAVVSGNVDWDILQDTLANESESCKAAEHDLAVSVTEPRIVGQGAQATVTVACVTEGNSLPLNFVYENIWKLSDESFANFATLVASAI